MRMAYLLVRDHLEQAQAILDRSDVEARKLQDILQLTINVIDSMQAVSRGPAANVIDFPLRSPASRPPD
jgi:hypothetical protein